MVKLLLSVQDILETHNRTYKAERTGTTRLALELAKENIDDRIQGLLVSFQMI
jgi:hypothetical protein